VGVYAQTSKFGKSFVGEADFAFPTDGEEVFEWKPLRPRRRDKKVGVSGQIRVRIREAALRDALAPGMSSPVEPGICDDSLLCGDLVGEGDHDESQRRRRCLKRIFHISDHERILSTFSCSMDNRQYVVSRLLCICICVVV
jgi:hypothetical protein